MTTAKTMIFSEIVAVLQKIITKTPILKSIPLLNNATFLMMVLPFLVPYATKTLKWIFNTVTYPFRGGTKKKEEKMEKKVIAEIGKDITNIKTRLDIVENIVKNDEVKSKPNINIQTQKPEININRNRQSMKV